MQDIKPQDELKEKSIEIILNFQPSEKFDKTTISEILKLKEDIRNAMAFLPEPRKEIFGLRFFQNLSEQEIAKKLNLPQHEVANQILNAIDEVKKQLSKKTYSAPSVNQKNVSNLPDGGNSFVIGFIGATFVIACITVLFLVFQYFYTDNTFSLNLFLKLKNSIANEEVLSNDFLRNTKSNHKIKKSNFIDKEPDKLKISGSSSLIVLSKKLQKGFCKDYPKYSIDLYYSDSNSGIDNLINGEIDIANSSRPISLLDQQNAVESGFELAEYRVALDALVILVNKNNPLDEISLDNLENIFNGNITNWQALNGKNIKIVPIARESGSGTNDFVINRILRGNDFPDLVTRSNSHEELIKIVSDNEGAVSFINSTNHPWDNLKVKYLNIKNFEDSVGFAPFEEKKLNATAIRYGDYPLSHYLYLVTRSEQSKKVQDFMKWVLSRKGQETIRKSGLLPINNPE
ncbi:MAG: hypothetical protein A3B68_01420 [Candidatus Melainabacteria bacterium RIFCSPHIGHO2_02_FULL_34_12]|nr:MAG: hypothetical protein A3B68_01420 [Candidatus Melainabacteria bacterium RIFCSPHIGHO2_02_FULL_34_12]